MSNSIRLITATDKTLFITPRYKKFLLRAGRAFIASKNPITLKLKDDGYCPEYHEELRYQRGRRVEVTKCSSLSAYDKYPDQDWEGGFELPDRATTGRKSLRCRPPRHPICKDEREFQRYKTGFLRRQSEEEADRVKLRSG